MKYLLILLVLPFSLCGECKLGNRPSENEKQYGRELEVKQYSETRKKFSGKITYPFSLYGWRVEVLYRDDKSISESARPKGIWVKKNVITEQEANVIADILYPKTDRGIYRKQIPNANFISHFFENGVVSFEMQLDKKRKNHVGVNGVRTVLYTDGAMFNSIKVNAYH